MCKCESFLDCKSDEVCVEFPGFGGICFSKKEMKMSSGRLKDFNEMVNYIDSNVESEDVRKVLFDLIAWIVNKNEDEISEINVFDVMNQIVNDSKK